MVPQQTFYWLLVICLIPDRNIWFMWIQRVPDVGRIRAMLPSGENKSSDIPAITGNVSERFFKVLPKLWTNVLPGTEHSFKLFGSQNITQNIIYPANTERSNISIWFPLVFIILGTLIIRLCLCCILPFQTLQKMLCNDTELLN